MTSSMQAEVISPLLRSNSSNDAGPEAGGTDRFHLSRLREIASLINTGTDPDQILNKVVSIVCQQPPWLRSGIMAVNRNSGYSELVTRYDPDTVTQKEMPLRWRLDTSPSLRVAETRKPLIIPDAQICPEFPGYQEDSRLRGYRTVVVLPLGCTDSQNRDIVLAVHSPERVNVSAEQLDFLTTIAHLAAISIDRAKLIHSERLLRAKMERALELRTGLMQQVMAGATLEATIAMVQTILPEPMLVIDLIHDRIFTNRSPNPSEISESAWRTLVRGPAARSLRELLIAETNSASDIARSVAFEAGGISFQGNAIVEALHSDRQVIGGIVLFIAAEGGRNLDRLQIHEARLALSVCLMRAAIEAKCQAESADRFFEDILNSKGLDSARIADTGARLGLDPALSCKLIAVRGSSAGGDIRQALRRALRVVAPECVVAQHMGVAFAILPASSRLETEASGPAARQFLEVLGWEIGAHPVVALSRPFKGARAIAEAHQECLRILSLARMFRRDGLLREEHFGSLALLLSAVEDTAVKTFLENTLEPLLDYDRMHNADLLPTITAYIDSGCKLQATANTLGIHVSTLRYRMKRLQEQFDLNVDDPETRFALSLAVRLQTAGNVAAANSCET